MSVKREAELRVVYKLVTAYWKVIRNSAEDIEFMENIYFEAADLIMAMCATQVINKKAMTYLIDKTAKIHAQYKRKTLKRGTVI